MIFNFISETNPYLTVEGFEGFLAGGFNWADVDTVGAIGEVVASGCEAIAVRGDPNGKWSSGSKGSGTFGDCGPD